MVETECTGDSSIVLVHCFHELITRMVETVVAQHVHIASSLLALADHVGRDLLELVRLSQHGHGVDEGGGQIVSPAQFTGSIVPGEDMMVVVEALSDGTQNGEGVLGRVNVVVVTVGREMWFD